MAHVFISYAHEDIGFMQRLRDELEKRGFKTWVDKNNLPPGLDRESKSWTESVAKAVNDASCVIVICSPRTGGSKWVSRELAWADEREPSVPIIPFLLEGDKNTIFAHKRLVEHTYINATGNYDDDINLLVAAVRDVIGMNAENDTQEGASSPAANKVITFKHHSLEWSIEPTSQISDQIQLGIELFREIIERKKGLEAIRKDIRFAASPLKQLINQVRIALVSQAIRIVHVDRDVEREEKLKQLFNPNLQQCIVAKVDLPTDRLIDSTIRAESVAFVATQNCLTNLAYNSISIGITGGSPISRFVDLMPIEHPKLIGTNWYALLATEREAFAVPSSTSANSLIARMLHKQSHLNGHFMPYLNPLRRTEEYFQHAQGKEKEELIQARQTYRLASNIDVAFLSIGTEFTDYDRNEANLPEMADLLNTLSVEEKKRCVGDILLRLLDEQGKRIGDKNDQIANDSFVYSIPVEQLRDLSRDGKLIWILVEQPQKALIANAILQANYANCLAVDSVTADRILRLY